MTYYTYLLEWSDRQAQLLREGRFAKLDLENLIEEVKELGKIEQWEDLYLDGRKRFEQKTKLKAPQFCPYSFNDIL